MLRVCAAAAGTWELFEERLTKYNGPASCLCFQHFSPFPPWCPVSVCPVWFSCLRDGRQGCNDFGWLWETGKRRGPGRKVLPSSLAPCAGGGLTENITRAPPNSWAKVDSKSCEMEASKVVWHKGLFGCQILTCIDLGTVRLFQHGASLQESSWTQPQCLVSFARAVGGGEAIPASHKEPVWGCVGCCRTPTAQERLSSVNAGGASLH